MPGIDGLQTLEQLRQMKPGVKVVMLSCVSDTRKVVQAIRLGAQDYLTKPFQKAELTPSSISVWARISRTCRAKWKNFTTTYFSWRPAPPCARFARRRRWSPTSIFPS